MSSVRFACPDCGARLKSPGPPGGTIDCPKCGIAILIPDEPPAPDAESPAGDSDPGEAEPRIKAPWEYAKEWARVRFALLLCTVAAGLTIAELATGELIGRFARRAFTPAEVYAGLAVGLLIGGFRIYAKSEFRHVPRQWVSRPLLWTCVGVEVALLVAVAGTAVALAAAPRPAAPDPELPPALAKGLSPAQQAELRRGLREARDLQSGVPVQRDPRVRAVSVGFGVSTLLAGILAILWPVYLKELAASVKALDAHDLGDKVLAVLGPGFLIWVLSTTIYQFAASATGSAAAYYPPGKAVTVLGLLSIQVLLIRIYWRLRKALRAKSRLRKPKARPGKRPAD